MTFCWRSFQKTMTRMCEYIKRNFLTKPTCSINKSTDEHLLLNVTEHLSIFHSQNALHSTPVTPASTRYFSLGFSVLCLSNWITELFGVTPTAFPPRGWCWECWDGSEDDTDFDNLVRWYGTLLFCFCTKAYLALCECDDGSTACLQVTLLQFIDGPIYEMRLIFCIISPGVLPRTQITSLVWTLLDHRKAIKVGSVGKVKMNKHLDISLNSIIILYSRRINPTAVYKCHVASACAR